MIPCNSCLKALNPYLDRELSDEDIVQVRVHLEDCAGCLHMFKFEESVRRLVRVRGQQQQAPESLRARIAECFEAERVRLLHHETRPRRRRLD
jgi:mycothiol system anti-sigma-R factor